MSETREFIPGPYTLQRQCHSCGGHDFDVAEHGPHLSGQCITCGQRLPDWIGKHEIGLKRSKRRRDGFAPELRMEILQRWQHRCAWCGISATESRLEVGHIIPRAQILTMYDEAVADHPLNLAPSCPECNAGAHMTSVPAINMLLLAAIRIGAKA